MCFRYGKTRSAGESVSRAGGMLPTDGGAAALSLARCASLPLRVGIHVPFSIARSRFSDETETRESYRREFMTLLSRSRALPTHWSSV